MPPCRASTVETSAVLEPKHLRTTRDRKSFVSAPRHATQLEQKECFLLARQIYCFSELYRNGKDGQSNIVLLCNDQSTPEADPAKGARQLSQAGFLILTVDVEKWRVSSVLKAITGDDPIPFFR